MSVAKHYKTEMIAMAQAIVPVLNRHLDFRQSEFLAHVQFDKEYEAEMKGFVDTIKHPAVTLSGMKYMNMLYELQSPTACAGVLWVMSNGTVLHGRNMDYSFHFSMPDGRFLNWPDVTFQATFHKKGKPLLTQVQWPGGVGLSTAMRFGGWSFEQNTRLSANEWHLNLEAAKKGGQVYGLVVRRIMETTPDYTTAVKKLYAANFMAPQYFIVSGAGPFEGSVLTIDRLGEHDTFTPEIQRVGRDAWHLVQTNDDLLRFAADGRRPLANELLSLIAQGNVSKESLMQFMHTTQLFNAATVYSTVMIPGTGYFKTILPNEAPYPVDGDAMLAGANAKLYTSGARQTGNWPNAPQGGNFPNAELDGASNRWAAWGHAALALKQAQTSHLPAKRPHHKRRFLERLKEDDPLSFMQLSWKLEA